VIDYNAGFSKYYCHDISNNCNGLEKIMLAINQVFKTILWSGLLKLNSEQSRLFHRYCQLVFDPSIDPEKQTIEMSRIWENAIQDEHLSDCLELVDYSVGAELSHSESDRQAYLSEYLQEEIEKLIRQSGREDILIKQQQLAIIEQNSYLQKHEDPPQNPTDEMTFAMILAKLKETVSELLIETII
jgi:hypothetical protein